LEYVFQDISQNPGTYAEEISKRIGWNRQTVAVYLRELAALGRINIERKGPMNIVYVAGHAARVDGEKRDQRGGRR
jgi:predicted transcriptional regulator